MVKIMLGSFTEILLKNTVDDFQLLFSAHHDEYTYHPLEFASSVGQMARLAANVTQIVIRL